jgi:hypothetical protein
MTCRFTVGNYRSSPMQPAEAKCGEIIRHATRVRRRSRKHAGPRRGAEAWPWHGTWTDGLTVPDGIKKMKLIKSCILIKTQNEISLLENASGFFCGLRRGEEDYVKHFSSGTSRAFTALWLQAWYPHQDNIYLLLKLTGSHGWLFTEGEGGAMDSETGLRGLRKKLHEALLGSGGCSMNGENGSQAWTGCLGSFWREQDGVMS